MIISIETQHMRNHNKFKKLVHNYQIIHHKLPHTPHFKILHKFSYSMQSLQRLEICTQKLVNDSILTQIARDNASTVKHIQEKEKP